MVWPNIIFISIVIITIIVIVLVSSEQDRFGHSGLIGHRDLTSEKVKHHFQNTFSNNSILCTLILFWTFLDLKTYVLKQWCTRQPRGSLDPGAHCKEVVPPLYHLSLVLLPFQMLSGGQRSPIWPPQSSKGYVRIKYVTFHSTPPPTLEIQSDIFGPLRALKGHMWLFQPFEGFWKGGRRWDWWGKGGQQFVIMALGPR